MHVLSALQLTLGFFSSVSLCLIDRKIFLLIIEIFVGIGGLVLCLFPRLFHEQQLELFQLPLDKGEPAEAPNLFILHILGGLQLCLTLISFLSRSGSNDEAVSRNVMTMWAQRFCLDVVVYRFMGARGAVDLVKLPENQATVFLVMLGIFIAAVIHLLQWPVFRLQITMATNDRTNLHLLLLEIYFFVCGILYISHPEMVQQLPGFGFVADVNTLMMERSVGVILVIVAIYIHNAQSYYDSRDKAPIFQAVLFVQLTQIVHLGVYLYQVPGDFPLQWFVVSIFFAALVFTNSGLGLVSALNGRPQLRYAPKSDEEMLRNCIEEERLRESYKIVTESESCSETEIVQEYSLKYSPPSPASPVKRARGKRVK